MRILKRGWCRLFHLRSDHNIANCGGPVWRCRRCGSEFTVPWAIPLIDAPRESSKEPVELAPLSSLSS